MNLPCNKFNDFILHTPQAIQHGCHSAYMCTGFHFLTNNKKKEETIMSVHGNDKSLKQNTLYLKRLGIRTLILSNSFLVDDNLDNEKLAQLRRVCQN